MGEVKHGEEGKLHTVREFAVIPLDAAEKDGSIDAVSCAHRPVPMQDGFTHMVDVLLSCVFTANPNPDPNLHFL